VATILRLAGYASGHYLRGDSKGSRFSRRTARFTSDDPILAAFWNQVVFCEDEFMSIHVTASAVVVSGADLEI